MGLHSSSTTTQVGPFCPPYFKLSRSCPCFFASLRGGASSSRRFSNALTRFWAKVPPGEIISLRANESKRILVSRNYSAYAYPALLDNTFSTSRLWSQETLDLRESRQRYKAPRNGHLQDTSCSSVNQTETALPDQRCVLPADKFNRQAHQPLRRDGGFVVNVENRVKGVQLTEKRRHVEANNLGTVNSWENKSEMQNGLLSVRNSLGFLVNSENVDRAVQSTEIRTADSDNIVIDKVNGQASANKRPSGLKCTRSDGGIYANAENHGRAVQSADTGSLSINKLNGWSSKHKGPNGLVFADTTVDNVRSNHLVITETSDQEELSGEDFGRGASSNGLNGTNKATTATVTETLSDICESFPDRKLHKKQLTSVYDSVLVVDNISMANQVVSKLINQYEDLVHACDTEVANIDVKQETPINHGGIICFSIYSGPMADFGNGKSCIWVDVLDGGGKDLLLAFKPFFEDNSIRKVWHNYSFDKHVIENYGIHVRGFHADTIHMARLWDSSRRINGGYSLEALTGNHQVMNGARSRFKELIGKLSMKTIFGQRKVKKDGSEGKIVIIAPVEELQRKERVPWICYSSLDAIKTLELHESLAKKLSEKVWKFNGKEVPGKSMLDFYHQYWKPFGKILVQMETEGMLVDRPYLAAIEKIARAQQETAVKRFRNWASKYCTDAKYMNVGSDAQLRQLFFGGISNRKDPTVSLPYRKKFKIPNVDNVIEEGKKKPTKFRNIELHQIGAELTAEIFTASGWPSASGDALKALAGKVSAEYYIVNDDSDSGVPEDELEARKSSFLEDVDTSAYGPALEAFPSREEGIEACHAIASLCEVCSIDSLISNFILPLQGNNISGKSGRIHCSLNINTETGRLSARRPNLQNQPALEKDRYKIRQAFVAAPGNSLVVADYGQLELRILAHVANCRSMLDAFKAGGDFHSRTAMNMYPHIRDAVETEQVVLEWYPQPGEEKPPVPLLKDAFGSERRKAKMLNFSIAYGKTPHGLAQDWKVSVEEAKETVDRWYSDRQEVLKWQEARKREARMHGCVHTLLGRARNFPLMKDASRAQRNHIERAAINTPIQGSAADVAMCAMLEISKNIRLKELGWRLLLQVHDEVILEGPSESAEVAKAIVVDCMAKPFSGRNILRVDLSVDAKCAQNWYFAK